MPSGTEQILCIEAVSAFYNKSFARYDEPFGIGEEKTETTNPGVDNKGIINPGDYNPGSNANAQNADELMKIGNSIIGFLQIIGTILSVLVLIVLGIKYMIGSAEERAQYKKSMMPYLVGAVMVFAITNILGIIVNISKNLL